ncbi:MAG: general stress protein [Acetobacteraceae bacterium]|nr:hypothetical protein [Pseudomonadota bacterium]
MAQRTIAHLYDHYEDAQKVVHDLEAAGVAHSEISMVSNSEHHRTTSTGTTTTEADASSGAGTGAVAGTAIGGGLGLAAGLGALAIPGIGPVVAAGWLIATLAGAGVGAAAGGLVGSLTGAGVSREEADVYAEGVRGGGTLVTVRTTDAEATRVEEIMGRHNPVDWRQRRSSYGDSWTGFDESRTVAVDPVEDVRLREERAGMRSGAVPPAGLSSDPVAPGSTLPETDPRRRL